MRLTYSNRLHLIIIMSKLTVLNMVVCDYRIKEKQEVNWLRRTRKRVLLFTTPLTQREVTRCFVEALTMN